MRISGYQVMENNSCTYDEALKLCNINERCQVTTFVYLLYMLFENEPDADERQHICQLYCSISISMPANDDHSFLSQMLRFAMYFTTCNCSESCKDFMYVFIWKVVQALSIFL